MKKTKNKQWKELLKALRPDLRPSLANKEVHKYLCWVFGEAWRNDPTRSGQWLTPDQIKNLHPPEAEIRRNVIEWELHFKANGFKDHQLGIPKTILAEYPEWRKRETARVRAEAARKKATAQAAAKIEADRIKREKKLARRKKPRITYLADIQKASDRQSSEDFLAQ